MGVQKTAYHGTSIEAKESILKDNHFILSNKDNEWAGEGAYFFINKNKEVAYNHAYKWSKNFKKISEERIATIEADIIYSEDEIFDLTNEDDEELFQVCRRDMFEEATKRAKIKNKILASVYTDRRKFDCLIINEICKVFGKTIVKRNAYIRCLEDKYDKYQLPTSSFPNCTILCIRNQKHINKIR